MKKLLMLACLTATISLACGTAMADSINGRIGVTGRIGFLIPADSEDVGSGSVAVDTDASFVGGGGFIYGIGDNIAVEIDITHAEFSSHPHNVSALKDGDFATTNVALGAQYRFINLPITKLVPYAGAGIDILINDFRADSGERRDVDTVLGAQLVGGVDYFIMKQLAITGEIKGVLAPNADIIGPSGQKIGSFDPSSVTVTGGVRYFFN